MIVVGRIPGYRASPVSGSATVRHDWEHVSEQCGSAPYYGVANTSKITRYEFRHRQIPSGEYGADWSHQFTGLSPSDFVCTKKQVTAGYVGNVSLVRDERYVFQVRGARRHASGSRYVYGPATTSNEVVAGTLTPTSENRNILLASSGGQISRTRVFVSNFPFVDPAGGSIEYVQITSLPDAAPWQAPQEAHQLQPAYPRWTLPRHQDIRVLRREGERLCAQ